jgi:hypothetical protein
MTRGDGDGHGSSGSHEQLRCEKGKGTGVARVNGGRHGFALQGRRRAMPTVALWPNSAMAWSRAEEERPSKEGEGASEKSKGRGWALSYARAPAERWALP